MNSDLLSKVGAGASKKAAPSSSKLGKTSTGPQASPAAGAFSEQLDAAGRAPAPRSYDKIERSSERINNTDQRGDQRVENEEAPVARRERPEKGSVVVESRSLPSRFKKNSVPAKEQSAELNSPAEPRFEMATPSPAPELKPAEPESFGEEEIFAQPKTSGLEVMTLRQPNLVKAAEKSNESANDLEQIQTEQGQVRRQAMQDFMGKMQREFGIPPEKIVEAFSRLDEETLMRPPEESTKQFLANLEVPPSQHARAAELYNTMVRTTGEAALNEKLSGAEQGVNMTVLSPREEALRKLNDAIDQLNNAFAMRNSGQPTSMAAPLDNPLKAQLAFEQMNSQLATMERAQKPEAARPEQMQSDDGDDRLMAAFRDSGKSDSSMSATPLMAGALAAPMAVGSDSGGSAGRDFGGDSGRSPSPQSQTGFQAQMKKAAAPTDAAKSFGKKLAVENAQNLGGETQAGNVDGNLAGAEAQATPISGGKAAAGPAGMMMQRPTPTAQDEQANVKELIRQAQLAIKKGGGEIKMDLKPEGIGQLHLKVSVENGQVNVQMLTDNDASKRLLEKGLHELKSNLAAHELKVDTMKVDVGQELKKHMDNSGDQAREQTRQFANDVMSQFRDERQAFQQGFMENQGWRQFGRNYGQANTGRGGTGSADTTVASTNARAKRPSSSGRLDLVA